MDLTMTEVIRRVFNEKGRHFIELGPHGDLPGFLELRTVPGDASAEYFGKMSLMLSSEMAEELGRALLVASTEIKKGVL